MSLEMENEIIDKILEFDVLASVKNGKKIIIKYIFPSNAKGELMVSSYEKNGVIRKNKITVSMDTSSYKMIIEEME